MTEKEQIEKITAKYFLGKYNINFGTSFAIVEQSDHPDILCEDNSGNKLNLEITLTEDRDSDIKALLGRSEHRNIEYVRQHGTPQASALLENVTEQLFNRITRKMSNNYGTDVALVVRDISPLEWNWNLCIKDIGEKLMTIQNPFDRGILLIAPHHNSDTFR